MLFEIAEHGGPGFAVGEPDMQRMGDELSLPPWLEERRKLYEWSLTPVPTTAELAGGRRRRHGTATGTMADRRAPASPPRAGPPGRLAADRRGLDRRGAHADRGGGPGAVKIDRLCARLGVTKGSFYWHFSDIRGYLDALAEAWAQEQRANQAALEELRDLEPEERLASMMRHLTGPRQWILERAMREWARWDADVAAQVRASDRSTYREVRRAFLDAGFAPKEAGLRARAAFVLGSGLHRRRRAGADGERKCEHEHILELLMCD